MSALERGTDNLTAREHAHRGAILLGIGSLLVLSVAPVLGHHIFSGLAGVMTGVQHLGAFCMVALQRLSSPVHEAFHIALLFGLAYALFDRWRGWLAVSRSLALLETRSPRPGEPIWIAALASDLDPARVHVVEGLPNPAFTVGLVGPRVYVAASLQTYLRQTELDAVISHEAAHVRRRDPLRVGACRFLACTLFWLPALRRLADDLADEVEIAADDFANKGRPLVLASAILRLAGWRQSHRLWSGAVGFQRDDLLERRIRRLAGEETRPSSHVTRGSLAGATLALLLVLASGILVAQPNPAIDGVPRAQHCSHSHGTPFAHLFCGGLRFHMGLEPCPHSEGGTS